MGSLLLCSLEQQMIQSSDLLPCSQTLFAMSPDNTTALLPFRRVTTPLLCFQQNILHTTCVYVVKILLICLCSRLQGYPGQAAANGSFQTLRCTRRRTQSGRQRGRGSVSGPDLRLSVSQDIRLWRSKNSTRCFDHGNGEAEQKTSEGSTRSYYRLTSLTELSYICLLCYE